MGHRSRLNSVCQQVKNGVEYLADIKAPLKKYNAFAQLI
jgi:hypothetical protein